MRNVLVVSILLFSPAVWGQLPGKPPELNPDAAANARRLEADVFEKWATDSAGPKKRAAQKQALESEEFYSKARRFVDRWQAFAKELNGNKTFNAKLAKEVSKAFHEMEKTDGWAAGREK